MLDKLKTKYYDTIKKDARCRKGGKKPYSDSSDKQSVSRIATATPRTTLYHRSGHACIFQKKRQYRNEYGQTVRTSRCLRQGDPHHHGCSFKTTIKKKQSTFGLKGGGSRPRLLPQAAAQGL